MNLKDALSAVAPVVGDGKLIPQHAYVLWDGTLLHATDGRQWVEVQVDGNWHADRFCVRYEPLRKALEREHTAIQSDGDNGLIVRYGRGRARLRGIDPASFPLLEKPAVTGILALPADFHERVRDLLAFCADGDGHVWQQAVHVYGNMLFAANSFALAKTVMDRTLDVGVGIPAWACKFIASREGEPPFLRERGDSMISLSWEGIELFTTLLTQNVPGNIIGFASNIIVPTDPVPEGLKEAVERIAEFGGKTCRIGNGEITYGAEAVELVDGLDVVTGPAKTWGVDSLGPALKHASLLDLSNTNATWAGEGYMGVFSGRAD